MRADVHFTVSPAILSPLASESSSIAWLTACPWLSTVSLVLAFVAASAFSLATTMSPPASTLAASSSCRPSSSLISSCKSWIFSFAASTMAFLALSAIHCGTSSPAFLSSAALHAAQRLAPFSDSCTFSLSQSGTSRSASFRSIAWRTAQFVAFCLSSLVTVSANQLGTGSPFATSDATSFLAHAAFASAVACSFRCSTVSSSLLLHHSGASGAAAPSSSSGSAIATDSE
mmetsp:Transcript_63488/g.168674  ORF Transcript_63488/g.168674 Transcript_63488/m.168674 type:complete len:230 (+) Transcript_63488:144-833(+)